MPTTKPAAKGQTRRKHLAAVKAGLKSKTRVAREKRLAAVRVAATKR